MSERKDIGAGLWVEAIKSPMSNKYFFRLYETSNDESCFAEIVTRNNEIDYELWVYYGSTIALLSGRRWTSDKLRAIASFMDSLKDGKK